LRLHRGTCDPETVTARDAMHRVVCRIVSCRVEQEVIAMIDVSKIKEQMEVKGSDGKHVGMVFAVENGRIKLASGGMEHVIDIGAVETITDGVVVLRKTAEETVRPWH